MLFSGIMGLISCKKDSRLLDQADLKTHPADSLNSFATTPANYVVSTFVGGNNPSGISLISLPTSICSAVDGSLYVTAYPNSIYKINPQGGSVKYLTYDTPMGIKAGANGSIFFTSNRRHTDGSADTNNVVKADRNKRTTVLQVTERFSDLADLAIGPDSSVYITDITNYRIIKLTQQGVTSILAGKKGVRGFADGQGSDAHFSSPTWMKFGEDGNLWVLDGTFYIGQSIRKVSMSGKVTTIFKLKPQYSKPKYITCLAVTKRDKNFNLTPYENVFFFVRSFTESNVVLNQLFHLSYDGTLTAITGNLPEGYKDGPTSNANFNHPNGLTVNPTGIYVADAQNNAIRRIAKQ